MKVFPYFATPNTELQTVTESVELAAAPDAVWAVIGQFNLDWHPLVARVSLTGTGVGQLRRIETRDGKEIVERLDAIDNAKRFYRYTLIAGIPASHYIGTIDVKPKGSGCVAEWRVQYPANNQPDIAVRTMVSTLLKTGLGKSEASLRSRRMSTIVEPDRPCPSATDGEIAAINLESARRRAWARFVQDARLPGVAEAVVDNERLAAQFLGDLDDSTVWRRSPRNSHAWTIRLVQHLFMPRPLRQCIALPMREATSRVPR